ncbi:MAG: hypothetical protein EXR79_14520 [Myxococcales bacterium]|nr:hypothetical protein [Myxococcales bacterium]
MLSPMPGRLDRPRNSRHRPCTARHRSDRRGRSRCTRIRRPAKAIGCRAPQDTRAPFRYPRPPARASRHRAPGPPVTASVPRLLFATSNAHKLREFTELCTPLGLRVLAPAAWVAEGGAALADVAETGETFLANALLKAEAAHLATGLDAVADDSGLCVDALGGAPGVQSARFAGPDASDAANRALLCERLQGVVADRRQARFQCVLVCVGPLADGAGCGRTAAGVPWRAFVGEVAGRILDAEQGDGGFGYDALFWHEGLQATFAAASAPAKHAVSHRGLAFQRLAVWLAAALQRRIQPDRPLFMRRSTAQALSRALTNDLRRGFRYADMALENALGEDPGLGPKEREAVAELHWFALRHLGLLGLADDALRARPLAAGPVPVEGLARDAGPRLAQYVMQSVDVYGKPLEQTKKAGLTSAFDALLARNLEFPLPAPVHDAQKALRTATWHMRGLPDAARLALEHGVHLDLWAALERDLGTEHATLALEYLGQRAPLAVRANRLKAPREIVRQALESAGVRGVPLAGLDDGLVCLGSGRLTALSEFRAGWFEVQDEGSQRIAASVDAQPGQTVIDWCAGAGGKTLALAAALNDQGRLLALDTHDRRLHECARRLDRAGVTCAKVRRLGPRGQAPRDLPLADRVLVDAPCTSTGALRRNPELRWHIDRAWIERFPAQQGAILSAAARHVKPGGRLVYATCSLLKAENEAVVVAFLASAPDFTLLHETRTGPASLAYLQTRPLPAVGPDGFYNAVMVRTDVPAPP